MYKYLVLILSIINPVISSISIPTKFSSTEHAIQTITTPKFFKYRIQYLNTPDYKTNIDLDNIKIDDIKWPLEITYKQKHTLKKFPLLPIPTMTTTEVWSKSTKGIVGDIKTPLLKISVNLIPVNREIVYLDIESTIKSKSIIVPFSNKAIEDDISKQVEHVFLEVLKECQCLASKK